MKIRCITAALLLLTVAAAVPALAQQEIRLWPGKAPGTENWTQKETDSIRPGTGRILTNVSDPTLTVYLPQKVKSTGTGIVVAPGGALRLLAMDDRTVEWLNDKGIAVFVLKYRTLQLESPPGGPGSAPAMPIPGSTGARPPEMQIRNGNANPMPDDAKLAEVLHMAVADAQLALKLVRRNATQWGVDPKKLGILGYSAGGGVAIGAALAPPGDAYPDFIISAFGPSLQDVVVPPYAPPLFMAVVENHWNVTNGLLALFAKWKEANKPAELHVYDQRNPPIGIRPQGKPSEMWIERAYEWLQLHDFAPQESGVAAAAEKISGELADGTYWAVDKPANWNGTLILDLDGAGLRAPPPGARPAPPPPGMSAAQVAANAAVGGGLAAYRDWQLAQGFAVGGTQREPVGYQFDRAVDNLLEVRQQFIAKFSQPRRTLVSGNSRGAFAARLAMERAADVFEGALISSGGGAGEIAVLRDKLNATFALKALVDPASSLTLVNHTDVPGDQAALARLVGKATASPQGRARLALAAAFEQFAPWSQAALPKPAPVDYDAQLDQIAASFSFANPPSVRAGVEKIAGGNVSWNTGVDYAKLLRRSGRETMVRALYAKAGLDLKSDLAVLARAPRVTADAAAVARYEKIGTYTGRIKGPIVNLDNDDPIDPASYKLAYLDLLKHTGNAGNFRLLWVDRAGHSNQGALDRAIALRVLVERLDTGKWGDTSLPALQRRGEQIGGESGNLGASSLFDPGKIPAPLFVWDARHWDSYRAEKAR